MRCRNDQPYLSSFNFGNDSVFNYLNNGNSSVQPPLSGNFLLLGGGNFLLLNDGSDFLLLG